MKKLLAEFLAVFFIVFLATAAIVADQQLAVVLVRDTFGPLGVALAYGLAYSIALAAVGRVSGGHANPAVTLAYYIARRISLKDMGGYIAAQLLGGILASLIVARVFPSDAVEFVSTGVPAVGPGTAFAQAGAIEIILTFILVFVIWRVLVDTDGWAPRAPLLIGLTVTTCALAGAPFTGGVMNPARWLGPALVSGQFANWPVWVLGPIVGALMASAVYELVFLQRESVGAATATGVTPGLEPSRVTTTSVMPTPEKPPVATSPAAHAAEEEEQPEVASPSPELQAPPSTEDRGEG